MSKTQAWGPGKEGSDYTFIKHVIYSSAPLTMLSLISHSIEFLLSAYDVQSTVTKVKLIC